MTGRVQENSLSQIIIHCVKTHQLRAPLIFAIAKFLMTFLLLLVACVRANEVLEEFVGTGGPE